MELLSAHIEGFSVSCIGAPFYPASAETLYQANSFNISMFLVKNTKAGALTDNKTTSKKIYRSVSFWLENKWSLLKEELARGGSVTIEGSLSSLDTVLFAGQLLSQKKPGMMGSKEGRGFTCFLFY